MLEMKEVSKNFDAVIALNKANLYAKSGRIMALLGSNGSGKSTLMKILSGLVFMSSGSVLIDDKPVKIRSSKDAIKNGIAVAYQDLSLIPAMSVLDNIVLGLEPKKKLGLIDANKVQETALFYLKKLNIKCDPDVLVQTLMPSEQSMVEIAKAMASQPKILVLDEATASLHADEVDRVFEVLEELKNDGVAIILVTHRMSEIFRICDDCTILKNGVTVAQDEVKNLNLENIVFHMTGRRFDTTDTDHEDVDHTGDTILSVKNLEMFPKLRDVNFFAKTGEIVGIGGLDGQGQSEFIRTLIADQKFEKGSIVFDNEEVNFKSSADAVSKEIGFISGDRNRESIFPLRSVAQNIYAGKAAKGKLFSYLNPKEINTFANNVVTDYDIVVGGLSHPANTLSGGNQQKLVIGRWIALKPKLLLLDDPTKGVDIQSRREIHNFLRESAADGMTVVYVSSDNDELFEISDRIYVFYEGTISAILEGENRTKEKFVSAMLGLNKQQDGDLS